MALAAGQHVVEVAADQRVVADRAEADGHVDARDVGQVGRQQVALPLLPGLGPLEGQALRATLHRAALGDVAEHDDRSGHLAVLDDRRRAVGDLDDPPVAAREPVGLRTRRTAAAQHREQVAVLLDERVPGGVLEVDGVVHVAAEQLVLAEPEQPLTGPVEHRHAAGAVDDVEPVGDAVDQRAGHGRRASEVQQARSGSGVVLHPGLSVSGDGLRGCRGPVVISGGRSMQFPARRRRLAIVAVLGAIGSAAPAASAPAAVKTTWLCRPGLAVNPCQTSLSTTRVTLSGKIEDRIRVTRDADPKIDCFYVYPTVSDQTRRRTREQAHRPRAALDRALIRPRATRRHCRVFAPMYRQITLGGDPARRQRSPTRSARLAYRDVRDAWRDLPAQGQQGARRRDLIGHSQGTFVLRRLIAQEIDRQAADAQAPGLRAAARRQRDRQARAATAAATSSTSGACRSRQAARLRGRVLDLQRDPARRRASVAPGNVGDRARRPTGLEVLCTNPAALARRRRAASHAIFPSGAVRARDDDRARDRGGRHPAADRCHLRGREVDDAYTGACSSADGADVLQIAGRRAPVLNAVPDADLGPAPDRREHRARQPRRRWSAPRRATTGARSADRPPGRRPLASAR